MKFEEALMLMKRGGIVSWHDTKYRMVQIMFEWGGEIIERCWELQELEDFHGGVAEWAVCDEVPFQSIMSDDWNEAKK